jgi:protein SCO1/2
MDELGAASDQVQPLFFTVDPERDTPAVMAEYVAAFDPRIVGLTGSPEQVRAAAQSFRIYFSKVEQESAPGGYTMDHSAYLYLMNPSGEFEAVYSHDDAAGDMAAAILGLLDGRSG